VLLMMMMMMMMMMMDHVGCDPRHVLS